MCIRDSLHDAWSQAEDAWDNEMSQPEQDWVPEFPEYQHYGCLLYTSDAADDLLCVDLGGRRIIKKNNRHE